MDKSISRNEKREQIRNKIQNSNIEERRRIVIPAAEMHVLNDETKEKRVCAYCRVSTDDPAQTTSYELQKKHYEEQINNTPGWSFAGIYADEGISATSLKNRDQFNQMIEDCCAGKIDVIITKNVSRFARNVVDCLKVVRKLAQLNPPVGVKFETEGFFSLDNTSEMILTVIAAAAQEESKTKSMSMNWSLEKRFDNGNFLTPVLLGYDHDADGNLIVNPEEAVLVKMIFYLFLFGFSTSEISNLYTELGYTTKRGNQKWNATSIREILKNERYCGNVLSWKTYTYDFWEHKKRKNKKNRKQVLEIDHHEAIVSHEIYDAVQIKLEMNRYAKSSYPLPTLDVIDDGALKGFVSVNRNCRGFSEDDYRNASKSVYLEGDTNNNTIVSDQDSFSLDGFEIVRSQFFSIHDKPILTISNKSMFFNTICMKKFQNVEYVELLINTVEKCIAIRPCDKNNPNAICWGRKKDERWISRRKSISGFYDALLSITGWNRDNKYRLCGQYLSDGENQLLLFDLTEPEIICFEMVGIIDEKTDPDGSLNENTSADNDNDMSISKQENSDINHNQPPVEVLKLIKRYPDEWENHFGYYNEKKTSTYFERIKYMDNWEILRPAQVYSTLGGFKKSILTEIRQETGKLLNEMGCAM